MFNSFTSSTSGTASFSASFSAEWNTAVTSLLHMIRLALPAWLGRIALFMGSGKGERMKPGAELGRMDLCAGEFGLAGSGDPD